MDQLPQRVDTSPNQLVKPEGRLPSGLSNLDRITQHTIGLAEDLTSWIELKLKLTQLEVEEIIDRRLNKILVGLVAGVTGFLALFFGLVTAALGLGEWLGRPVWGFLIVTLFLALIAGGLMVIKPNLTQRGERRVLVGSNKLAENIP